MADSPATSGTSFEDHKTGYLTTSLDIPRNVSSRRRSTSVGSAKSAVTFIDDHSEVPILDNVKVQKIQRRRTQVAEVKISWWQCFKGVLFGPRVTMRAATKSIVIPYVEDGDDVYEKTDCPWILNVHALTKTGTDRHQEARCTFDTGCLQGNIISKEFALRLGYTESDYQVLKPHERHGGTSVTGHAHMPEGALHITWYHNSSPRLYDGMRFLVSPDTQSQLIIGARSIQKHKLLSAPNLTIEADRAGITIIKKGSDKAYDKLRSEEAKLKNDLDTAKHNRRGAERNKNDDDFKKYDAEVKKKQKQLKIKKLQVELYAAKADVARYPQDSVKEAVVQIIERDLKDLTGSSSGESSASLQSPAVNVSDPSGNIRSATGFSNRSGRSRQRQV